MGLFRKRYTGYTEKTMENRMTGAGAYFQNYDPMTDTFTSAVASGKLIGATKGGGNFVAKASIRPIEVDGIPGKVKGMEEIDSWDVDMTANILEITAETLKTALGAATISDVEGKNYKKVLGKNTIDAEDYQDNITFLGTVSGFEDPVIVQVFNALSIDGLNVGTKDKDDAVVPVKWTGHYSDASLDNPPFAIWVPVKATGGIEEGGTE